MNKPLAQQPRYDTSNMSEQHPSTELDNRAQSARRSNTQESNDDVENDDNVSNNVTVDISPVDKCTPQQPIPSSSVETIWGKVRRMIDATKQKWSL